MGENGEDGGIYPALCLRDGLVWGSVPILVRVLLGPGPRSVCVAPFASGPSLCL